MVESIAPTWLLKETKNSFTIEPNSSLCVQTSLTIDKVSQKATEHETYELPEVLTSKPILGILGILNIY